MGFVEIDSIMLVLPVLHVYTTCLCIMLCFVLCCAYHVGDKNVLDSIEYKVFGDNHVFLFLKYQMIMCFHTSPFHVFMPYLHTFAYDVHTQPLTC